MCKRGIGFWWNYHNPLMRGLSMQCGALLAHAVIKREEHELCFQWCYPDFIITTPSLKHDLVAFDSQQYLYSRQSRHIPEGKIISESTYLISIIGYIVSSTTAIYQAHRPCDCENLRSGGSMGEGLDSPSSESCLGLCHRTCCSDGT